MQELGIDAKIEFAPFNQVFQQLLNPLSLLFADSAGIKVILLRFSDWQYKSVQSESTLVTPEDVNQVIRSHIDEWVTALSGAIQRSPSTVLVFICPEAPSKRQDLPPGGHPVDVTALEDLLVMKTAALDGVRVVTTRELENLYTVADLFDASADAMASIPYTANFYAALVEPWSLVKSISCCIHRIRSLFSTATEPCGTVFAGEDGAQGIRIDGGRRCLQEFIVNQNRQGMLVCLCSKNNESDVLAVFDGRSDMILKREHITAWRINWHNKSENIQSLSQELGLALDSFIFIDDDPVQCAEARERCPDVLSLLLPSDAKSIPMFLQHVWAFDRNQLSKEITRSTLSAAL